MPFCTQCGNQMGEADRFCARCGSQQGAPAGPNPDLLGGMSAKTASILCYIPFAGWIAAIIVLASQKFRDDRTVRFHAFQGLWLFIVWLLLDWVVMPALHGVPGHGMGPFRMGAGLLNLAVLIAWIWMIIKTSQGQLVRLPIIGELSDRLVVEQR